MVRFVAALLPNDRAGAGLFDLYAVNSVPCIGRVQFELFSSVRRTRGSVKLLRTMPNYEVSLDQTRLDVKAIHSFLSQSYWSLGIPITTVEMAIKNSICVGAYLEEQQVGFARVITDRATFAYLADVFVLEKHRGQGLSQRMLEMLFNHSDVQGMRRMMLATRDAHGLYEKFGFKALGAPTRFMEKHDPNVYAVPVNSDA